MVVLLRQLLLVASISEVGCLFYDVLQPHQVPAPGITCMEWADAGTVVNARWATPGSPPAGASDHCAQQGNGATATAPTGRQLTSRGTVSYCIDAATRNISYCQSARGVPEQVNVQVASPDSVVVGFVTFEAVAPKQPPTLLLSAVGGTPASTTRHTGVTHVHLTASPQDSLHHTYYMHYVLLSNLSSRGRYSYQVQSGGSNASLSDTFSFRAPYAGSDGPGGATRIALFGDMGVYSWNNMQNLYEETSLNETADLIIHAGDHAYNEGDGDERRADGYMQAYQQTVANAPWMPILGNHEFYAGSLNRRFLDQTWEKWGPLDMPEASDASRKQAAKLQGHSSATSAMGAFLSAGSHHGPATTSSGGTVPSHTSRYFSVNFGLTHLVALSMNGYNGVDTCTTVCNQAQLAWLKEDLAAVDRSKTPWVIAISHYPMYMSQEPAGQLEFEASAGEAWLNAETCEYEGHARNCTGGEQWQATQRSRSRSSGHSSSSVGSARLEIEPILHEMGVDLYWAGHIHYYQTFDGPLWGGKLLSRGTHNPNGIIHVCSGNGGPPSKSPCGQYNATGKNSKLCIDTPFSYTRLTAHNETDLTWQQISNQDDSVIDEWVLHQEHHGPRTQPSPDVFPPPPPLPPSLRWVVLPNGTTQESDLPANAIRTGGNIGGGTYICRVPSLQIGESDLGGSLSFARADGQNSSGVCRIATSNLNLEVTEAFEVLVDLQPANASSYGWAPVKTTNTRFDLPRTAIQTGVNDEGPTYICRTVNAVPIAYPCKTLNDTNMSGSLSYFYEMKGNPHFGVCRLGTPGPEKPGLTSNFEVMVSPAPPPPPPGPPALPAGLAWVTVAATTTAADLPAHVVAAGNNNGGATYICLIAREEGGATDLVGSLSYSGGPGHCRAATDAAPFVRRTNLGILTAATPATFSWVTIQRSISHSDLPSMAVQVGHADGEPTFLCRVPKKLGTPGHVLEARLTGSVSYTRKLGECRVVTAGQAFYVSEDFEVMVAAASHAP